MKVVHKWGNMTRAAAVVDGVKTQRKSLRGRLGDLFMEMSANKRI